MNDLYSSDPFYSVIFKFYSDVIRKGKKKLFHRNQKQKESPHFLCAPVKKILIGDASGSGLADGRCAMVGQGHGTHRSDDRQ